MLIGHCSNTQQEKIGMYSCINSESNKIRAEKETKQVIALRGFKVELMYFSAIYTEHVTYEGQ